ncbi:hypothetical protein H0X32_01940 [Patescibacteria group bacterium]|nr:hypothetical protein [Patescibacteria group bacterium]
MLLWEVVTRREAHGSYLKRHVGVKRGTRFKELQVEFFLKTKGRKWKSFDKEHPSRTRVFDLPRDDPLAEVHYDGVYLYRPDEPFTPGTYFLRLENEQVYQKVTDVNLLSQMSLLAQHAFLLLEYAWAQLGYRLVDFKVEFGIGPDGRLYIADVIDNDSWRLIRKGKYVDKQGYRDGSKLDEVLRNYQEVAERSDHLARSIPRLVTWANRNLKRIP